MRRALLGLMLVSCTLPTLTYDDASVPDSGQDATFLDAGDGGDVGDAQPTSDAGDAAADPCDQDHDGYRSAQCDGGNDCNDHDGRVHPGLTAYVYDVPDAFPWGDWDCNGTKDEQYPTPLNCTLGIACNNGLSQGFVATDPGCGVTAPFDTCTGLCQLGDAGTRTQGCL